MQRADVLKTILLAALLGVPVAVASILLLALNHALEHLVWHDLPQQLGIAGDAGIVWWYVVAVTTLAAGLAALLLSRVREDVTHAVPLEPVPFAHLPWLLAGAAATLAGGLVLGPEAPLLTLGVALAAYAARQVGSAGGPDDPTGTVLSLAGAATVLGVVLGNPLTGVVLLLEMLAASGRIAARQITPVLVPAMLAAGIGGLIYVGFGAWSGIESPTLVIPDLPGYTTVRPVDLLLAVPVSIAAALVVRATQGGAHRLASFAWLRSVPGTATIGLATGVIAVAYRALADRPVDDVLFSGQASLPEVVTIGTAWVLALLVIAKGAAYVLALVGQLEGGQIFPALAISAAVGGISAIVVPDASITAMLAASIAAGTTALQRLPIFGVVFALLLVAGSNAMDVIPIAILGAVTSYLIAAAPPATKPQARSEAEQAA